MDMNKLVTTTLVSLALAAAAPLVAAQATAPDAPQKRQAQRPDHGKRDTRLPSERVETRLAQAKTKLKITAAQEAQWNAFADVTRRHAKAADERIKAMRDGKESQAKRLTAVERLERRQQMAVDHSQRLTEVIAAAKPLYAALSAEQKAIADDMLTPRRGHSGRGHHRPA
jgi:glucose/arabinose dehydrogenase